MLTEYSYDTLQATRRNISGREPFAWNSQKCSAIISCTIVRQMWLWTPFIFRIVETLKT